MGISNLSMGQQTEPLRVETLQPLVFFVEGRPQTAGSKTAVPITNGQGERVATRVVESGDRKAKAAWREDVREAARRAIAEVGGDWPTSDALSVRFEFSRRRPKGHYGSGRNAGVVKDSAPRHPTTRPDLLKVARAVEDALSGIVWHDDSVIVEETLGKGWGDREGLTVAVRRL